jgi:hypothetical protein
MAAEHLSTLVVTDTGPDGLVSGAILRTLIYADIFDFPMTAAEIHQFLIACAAPYDAVCTALETSTWLAGHVERAGEYFHLRGRSALVALRQERDAAAGRLWPIARRYGRWLAHLPFVRMVALTGSLAMRNPRHAQDDIDFLLVTAPRRVWLARAFAIVVVRVARLQKVGLCPNYVLAETALEQAGHDMYMAHEMAQMIPLSGAACHAAMTAANPWTAPYLPNASAPFYADAEPDGPPRGVGRFFQRVGEWLFGGWRGDALDDWEQRRKIRRFEAETGGNPGAAHLDQEHVKGHFQDHGQRVLARYAESLRAYGLAYEGPDIRASGWAPSAVQSGVPIPVGAPFQPVVQ